MAAPAPPPAPPPAGTPPAGTAAPDEVSRFASPGEAKKCLIEEFNYWSAKLTDSSFGLSLALVGANWAVFGSVTSLLRNPWAKLSISCVIVSLAFSLAGAWYMAELHRKRFDYAEAEADRWRQEFKATMSKVDPWPFSAKIQAVGAVLRWSRMLLPLAAGAFFLVGLAVTPAPSPKPGG